VRDSKAFEQQIHRIHDLLEGPGAEVTWDDHFPDPDNPSQLRQIDITIRRDGKLTLIECREHQFRQDVQWIEELIGRRASLRADAIIAVSSSGFTEGALRKSKTYGIVPRDLRELTEREVKDWGRQIALTLYFYQYSELELSLCFKRESVPKLRTDLVKSEMMSYPGMQSLFNAAAKQLDTLKLMDGENAGRVFNFGLRLQLEGFHLSGEPVIEVDFRGKAEFVAKEIVSSAVFVYGKPEDSSTEQEATVESFALGRTSIIHNADRISVFLDVSQVEIPSFCQFRFFKLSGEDEVEHEAVELAGLDQLWVQGKEMKIRICST
jgi:hypothetical protein